MDQKAKIQEKKRRFPVRFICKPNVWSDFQKASTCNRYISGAFDDRIRLNVNVELISERQFRSEFKFSQDSSLPAFISHVNPIFVNRCQLSFNEAGRPGFEKL